MLARALSFVPSALHLGARQALLRQSAEALQELNRIQAWLASSRCSSSGGFDVAVASTSYATHGQLDCSWRHHQHGATQLLPVHPHIAQQHRSFAPAAFPHLPLQLQQQRSYRIPNRVAPPKVAYSVRSGRPPPQPWPEFETVKAPQGEVRWHRGVLRFPPEVAVQIEDGPGSSSDRTLVLSGKAGTIRLSLQDMDPTGLLAFRLLHLPATGAAATGAQQQQQATSQQQRSLLVLASPNKARFDAASDALNRAIRGVMSGYLVGLTVKGVGYRMEPVEDPAGEVANRVPKLTYSQLKRRARAPGGALPKPYYFEDPGEEKQNVNFPYSKPASAIRLKVGYSRTVVYPLPPHIRAFCLKPTLLYLYGLELDELQRVAAEIRAIRKPNPYTGNGVQYVDEVVKLKQRARAK